ncbi:uncharacterized protein PG986_010609 [Apiospora aurea]|uniref:Uncharacterized protein n=1 Tax=Apiospora aurea TaxID=335848 RepID=A0ABR1Q2P9_9PEZI
MPNSERWLSTKRQKEVAKDRRALPAILRPSSGMSYSSSSSTDQKNEQVNSKTLPKKTWSAASMAGGYIKTSAKHYGKSPEGARQRAQPTSLQVFLLPQQPKAGTAPSFSAPQRDELGEHWAQLKSGFSPKSGLYPYAQALMQG